MIVTEEVEERVGVEGSELIAEPRYFIVTFATLEPGGYLKFVAPLVPLQGSSQSNHLCSSPNVNIDGHLLVSSAQEKVSPPTCSEKPFASSSFFGSKSLGRSQNKSLINSRTKASKVCGSSQERYLVQDCTNATCSPDLVKDFPATDKPVQKGPKKKAKKKGAQRKKHPRGTHSTVLNGFSEEGASGTSFSETYVNNGLYQDDGSISDIKCAQSSKGSCPNDGVDLSEPSRCHNLSRDDFVVNPASKIQTQPETLFTCNGEGVDAHLNKINFFDISSEVFSDGHSTSTSDSVSDDSTKKIDYSQEVSIAKEKNVFNLSEPSGSGNKTTSIQGPIKYLSSESFSTVVLNADNHSERTNCGSLGCSSSHSHLNLSGKRDRHGKALSGSSIGRNGKENNGSLCWQKVQRNDGNENICEPNDGHSVGSQFDVASKESLKSSSHADSNVGTKPKVVSSSLVKVYERTKRKASGEREQKHSSCSRKGSNAGKTNSNRASKMNFQLTSELPSQVHHNKGMSTGSSRLGLDEIDAVESQISKPVENSKVCQDETELLVSCNLIDQAAENKIPIPELEPLDETHISGAGSCGALDPAANRSSKSEMEVPHGVLQKWIPVVRKDVVQTSTSKTEKSLLSNFNESIVDERTIKNIKEHELSSSAQSFVPTKNPLMACATLSYGDVDIPTSKAESETHNISVSVKSVNKLTQSINEAYRVRLVSESYEQATGSPLAEFEKLLQSAAPVLSQTNDLLRCDFCSHHQFTGSSLCTHNIPNISVGGLWQWYEKHGSYGLEIRAEDYQNPKRMGIDRFEFRAYFVPFLSAIQLFGYRNPSKKVLKPCDPDNVSEVSNCIDHLPIVPVLLPPPCLPIISVLLPQPCGENKASPTETSSCTSESSSGQDGVSNPFKMEGLNESELLFEYFESEPPQQRRPLFEKIKELVGCDGSLSSQLYGDPKKLDSLDLHDLHPDSWYSVAWYPIYKIPDGNLRAAFLTYHSIGHFVLQSNLSDSIGGVTSIVSPVVGLQSYNAQAECWFQLKSQTKETPGYNPSEILKERLSTLEKTASDMARAVISKGNVTSANRQPDYEFFLSRQRQW
ncbi:hypothetical protein GIB67_036034 [Kingdonia uniflora]|uniref:Uncharacterized protein n=1 Tax=Kingdonia uniflora TaxID=39325 RepID=A0A7J7N124_9MAGN|nr:hypothetical protein GIB67_036034 [Kingdonia uniflora]